jgi:hypothetical protein
LKNFDFYEFAGLIVPGVLIMIGGGALWPDSSIAEVLLPTTTGAALINIVTAYGVGHMIQAIANLLESLYWRRWKGMPTDWVINRPKHSLRSTAIEDAIRASGYKGEVKDLKTWRQVFGSARAKVYDAKKDGRVSIFNGSYSLFRSLTVCGLVFLASAWSSDHFHTWAYPVLIAITGLCMYRMHHFALLYARELHACIANVANEGDKRGD